MKGDFMAEKIEIIDTERKKTVDSPLFAAAEKVSGFLNPKLKNLAVVFLTMSILLAFANVVTRYIFDTSYQSVGEWSRYALVYAVFLATGVTAFHDEHIKVDILVSRMAGKSRRILLSVLALWEVGVCIFVFKVSLSWISNLMAYEVYTLSGQTLLWIPGMALPIGFGMMILLQLCKVVLYFKPAEEIEEEIV